MQHITIAVTFGFVSHLY